MFVAALVIGLLVASEWARRLAIRSLCEATAAAAREARSGKERRQSARSGSEPSRRVVPLRPEYAPLPTDDVMPVPQWQRDP